MIHAKKVLPEYFEALRDGSKTYELRLEEPGEPQYTAGDYLALNEHDPARPFAREQQYTGRCMLFKISHVLRDDPRLAEGCVALSLERKPLSFEDLKSPGFGRLSL